MKSQPSSDCRQDEVESFKMMQEKRSREDIDWGKASHLKGKWQGESMIRKRSEQSYAMIGYQGGSHVGWAQQLTSGPDTNSMHGAFSHT